MEWFGLRKSLKFNRLQVPKVTWIKLNITYSLGCKFDPFYWLPLRCILIGYLGLADCVNPTLDWNVGSPLGCSLLSLMSLITPMHWPLSLLLSLGSKFTPPTIHWLQSVTPHRPQPLCTDSSLFQRTSVERIQRCKHTTAPHIVNTLLCIHYKIISKKYFQKTTTDWKSGS